ncbi:putative Aspartic proteinase nepenthesin-1 [Melia azedarach]|uniref:Aspartic proteinase nepenthesin-1 n=1 Tax=Melia azedarach TaxID=155640 RepID=A0ACC1XDS8_MELAZ|nr:putative Aspartic proteinase nepenthesin-1 [Melia azedarach]
MAILLAAFYSLIFTPITIAAIPGRPKRLIIELIHRDSVHSPYHNQNENVTNRIERAMKSSIARFAYLQAKIESNSANNIDYQVDILPSMNYSLFYMNFSIGQPSIPQFTVMDTGSSLLWIQCHPCSHCSKQFGPIFDPSKSSSYSALPCHSRYCRYSPGGKCNFSKQCTYNQTYLHGFSSAGILATEQLNFKTSDEGTILVPGVVFGCGNDNEKFQDRQLSGVFGLGFSRSSLVSQLDSTFSYCIGNLFDPFYVHNKLILGHGARIEGDSTPLEVINGHYFITLEAISVDGRKLDINPNIFRRKTWDKDGVIIDTGIIIDLASETRVRSTSRRSSESSRHMVDTIPAQFVEFVLPRDGESRPRRVSGCNISFCRRS